MSVKCKKLGFIYDPGGPYESRAVDEIDLTIEDGEYVALIGPTGSGKSTLLSLIGGLQKPTQGQVFFDGTDLWGAGVSKRKMRESVGLVFQYPEYQLFEATILKDAAYGPKNLGLSEEDATEAAKRGLTLAGLDESCWEKSPFDLSGGEKRRAALAGVLAMNPKTLILDEPAAGLDPKGRNELYALLRRLNDQGMTILIVSHSMEDVAQEAGRVLVLNHGKLVCDGTPGEVFLEQELLEEMGLEIPEMALLMRDLQAAGMDVDLTAVTVDQAFLEITKR